MPNRYSLLSREAPSRNKRGRIFIVSGPSGSGKTTLIKKLAGDKRLYGSIIKVTTVTTRLPRENERRRKDYIFVSKEEFLKREKSGGFVESQEIFGHYYGVPKKGLLEGLSKGRDVLLCIDVRGALCVKKLFPRDTVLIFISAPDLKSLNYRLRLRSTEKRGPLLKRLKAAGKELAYIKYYDYAIVNKDLSYAPKELSAIIMAERLKIKKAVS